MLKIYENEIEGASINYAASALFVVISVLSNIKCFR